MQNKVKNLVICSTLNQITNYLIINILKPEKVYNITFNDDSRKEMGYNIKIKEWDKALKKACEPLKVNIKDVEISNNEARNIEKLRNTIKNNIIDPIEGEIYWHITGGQRIISLAINNIIIENNRKEDTIMYVDGNTDKLIVYSGDGKPRPRIDYSKKDLNFQTALNLSGFRTSEKELKNTYYFKKIGKTKEIIDNNEHEFYLRLYEIINNHKDNNNLDGLGYEKEFRNGLLKSNSIKNHSKNESTIEEPSERSKNVINLFKELDKKTNLIEESHYDIFKAKELYMYYPAGYIFEKIVAHKIYSLVKNNNKIVEMVGSLKTYFDADTMDSENDDGKIKDEIDIALLTDTGKIINFECKSGGMQGDNAKSTKYTTYRLSGVFGMPILMSPLYKEDVNKDIKDESLKNQIQAVRAANAAELEVIYIDEIKDRLKDLRILNSSDNEEE